jgi:endonuclease/exonuclease/phosphatase family metal-dependent hydrolase
MRIAALGAAALLTAVPAVSAQTTLRSAKDSTIRGGSYAYTNFGSDPILETRQSDDLTYVRRAAVMFDTDASFSASTSLGSAQLVLTVAGGNGETRTLTACAMPISFDEDSVTWVQRNSSAYWSNAGGDIVSSDCSYATVTATSGSRVTFDVTTQVQKAVAGTYGTRYARFLVADYGGSSRDSYKQYYSNNASDSSVQPALIVSTGSSSSSSTSSSSSSSTSSSSSSSSASNIVLWAGDGRVAGSSWQLVADSSAAGGSKLWNPDRGTGKLSYPSSSPSSYVDFTFTPVAGVPYRLWIRAKADGNDYTNDSLFVQFSASATSGDSALDRIGTTSGEVYSLESCSGVGESGWGWEDTEYCGDAAPIYFSSSSAQTLRIQQREDGISVDQIVLSPSTYLTSSPGSQQNDTRILSRTGTSALTQPTAPAPVSSTSSSSSSSSTTTTSSGTTLRVLQWNIHHGGYGTDGVYDPNRVATWMASFNPDVILVNEIEKYTSWGNQDQPEVYKNLLQQKTGKTWYYIFAQEFGQWSSNGKGNAIFSTVPFNYTDRYELVHNYDRSIAEGSITWNGRTITLISTHLDPYDQSLRLTQASEVTSWASKEPENRIITGDMNAWPDQSSIAQYDNYYYDSWAVAAANGTAYAFSGNSGETKNGRIDYIFYSKNNSNLSVKSSQVYDTRDSNGVMPSDHRPVLTTFYVR